MGTGKEGVRGLGCPPMSGGSSIQARGVTNVHQGVSNNPALYEGQIAALSNAARSLR